MAVPTSRHHGRRGGRVGHTPVVGPRVADPGAGRVHSPWRRGGGEAETGQGGEEAAGGDAGHGAADAEAGGDQGQAGGQLDRGPGDHHRGQGAEPLPALEEPLGGEQQRGRGQRQGQPRHRHGRVQVQEQHQPGPQQDGEQDQPGPGPPDQPPHPRPGGPPGQGRAPGHHRLEGQPGDAADQHEGEQGGQGAVGLRPEQERHDHVEGVVAGVGHGHAGGQHERIPAKGPAARDGRVGLGHNCAVYVLSGNVCVVFEPGCYRLVGRLRWRAGSASSSSSLGCSCCSSGCSSASTPTPG